MAIVVDSEVVRCFWRVLDRLDYWTAQARLWTANILCGPSPDCDPRD
ncbi:MAG: hypothetical protein JO320_11580 [Alphaproteobacteria bacterium]|nr:hypothetical protein [Alphaproteobacteria bacterium]